MKAEIFNKYNAFMHKKGYYRVTIGHLTTREEAEEMLAAIQKDVKEGFVLELL